MDAHAGFAELGALLFAEAADALLVIDPSDGRVCDANPAAERLFARPHVLLCGLPYRALFASPDGDLRFRAGEDGERQVYLVTEGDAAARAPVRLRVRPLTGRPRPRLLLSLGPPRAWPPPAAPPMDLSVEAADIGLWDYDPERHAVRWSEGFRRLIGVPEGVEERPELFAAGLEPHELARLSRAVDEALDPAGDGGFRCEYRFRRLDDGSVRWLLALGRAYFQGEGAARRPYVFGGATLDITERKRVEEAVHAGERRFRALVETLPYGVVEVETSGLIQFANPAYERLHGFAPGAAVGVPIWHTVSEVEGQRDRLRSALAHALREQPEPTPSLYSYRAAGGERRVAQVDWGYKSDTDGAVVGFVCVVTDVTDRLRAEERLRAGEERLARVVEATADGIVLVDPSGRITLANAAAASILGRPHAALVGARWPLPGWRSS